MGNSRNSYLIKNTIIFTLGNLGSKLISFFLIPLYTNALTTAEYGVVDLVATVGTVAVPLLTLNICESVMRFALDEDANTRKITQIGTGILLIGMMVGKFEFDFAETEDEVCKFTGSKYVKSNPEGVYKKILEKLKLGRKVLFIGLPCQVSAVRHYTKNHQNLYTADLICHGTPSPQILDSFLSDYGIRLTEVQSIRFREKNNFKLEQNGKRFAVPITTDNYLMTFLNSTTYTENCYQCQYAKIERPGDITLGDSWGSELEKSIQDKGISLVLCQNEKGKELIDQADLTLLDVDLKKAIESNHQLYQPSQKPKQREAFFKELKKGYGFKKAVKRCYPKKYLKNIVKTVLYNMKFMGGQNRYQVIVVMATKDRLK